MPAVQGRKKPNCWLCKKNGKTDRETASELMPKDDAAQKGASLEETESILSSRPLIPGEKLRQASGSDIDPAYRSRPAHVPGRVRRVRPEGRKL